MATKIIPKQDAPKENDAFEYFYKFNPLLDTILSKDFKRITIFYPRAMGRTYYRKLIHEVFKCK